MTAERDSMTLKEISYSALGVEERSDEAPRAGASAPLNIIESLLPFIVVHLHRPTLIRKRCADPTFLLVSQ